MWPLYSASYPHANTLHASSRLTSELWACSLPSPTYIHSALPTKQTLCLSEVDNKYVPAPFPFPPSLTVPSKTNTLSLLKLTRCLSEIESKCVPSPTPSNCTLLNKHYVSPRLTGCQLATALLSLYSLLLSADLGLIAQVLQKLTLASTWELSYSANSCLIWSFECLFKFIVCHIRIQATWDTVQFMGFKWIVGKL